MTFKEYYGELFRADLDAVVSSGSPSHSAEGEVTIQPRTLSTENPVICSWDRERIDLFSTALFFTVLVDQVCYTYFRYIYTGFQSLTCYPKFRGDCTGGCRFHLHPKFIFEVITSSPGPAYEWSGTAKLLKEAINVMHFEVIDFFKDHIRCVDGEEFWVRCANELP